MKIVFALAACSVVLYCVVWCFVAWRCVVFYCVLLCFVVLFCVILRLRCVVLGHIFNIIFDAFGVSFCVVFQDIHFGRFLG